jgi:hypothetical protein
MEKKVILTLHSKGSVGKSTFCEALSNFYDELNVDWQGFDLDDRHHNFFDRHPKNVEKIHISREQDINEFMQKILLGNKEKVVQIVDSRAQVDEMFISAFEKTNIIQNTIDSKVSLTIVLFPCNDSSAMKNLARIVNYFRENVEYIVVKNPAQVGSFSIFDNSKLPEFIDKCGGYTIEMPSISAGAMAQMASLENQLRRGLSFIEYGRNSDIYGQKVFSSEILYFLNKMQSLFLKEWRLFFPSETHEFLSESIEKMEMKFQQIGKCDLEFFR